MKPTTTMNMMALATLIGATGTVLYLATPWLAFPLTLISAVNCMAFESSYRRWRPWAVEAVGLPDPNTTTIAIKGMLAELSVWASIYTEASNWTVIGIRLIWGLVQLAEIGKFGHETEQQKNLNEQY